ncbi:unnamed protein product [Caenorhabditis brenneri]
MNLENTTESLCDQLKKFVVEQMEEKRMLEQSMKERNEVVNKVLAIIGLVILAIAILTALGFFIVHLWRVWKSRRAGSVTRIPKTPISNKNLLEWNPALWGRNKVHRARIYYDSKSFNTNRCTEKLEEIVKVVFKMNSTPYFTHQTRVITIRMDGFSNGAEFHEFEPSDGVIARSHFTYQMYGEDTIQVTRYVVGMKSYVAGFCIYVKDHSVRDIEISMNVVKKLMKEAKYPGREAVEKKLKEKLEKMNAGKWQWQFWKWTQKTGMKEEHNEVAPSYSSLLIA